MKLRRVNASPAKPYPPDGENLVWWTRLKQALGTSSSDFVYASLYQLQAAAQQDGILKAANQNARDALTAILNGLGFEQIEFS